MIYSSPLIVWYWQDQLVTELHWDPWFCQQTLKPTIWPPWSTSVRRENECSLGATNSPQCRLLTA